MSSESNLEVLAEGKYLRLVNKDSWEYVERRQVSGVVTIIAVTPDGKLVMVEQYRPALGCNSIELPAGLVGDVKGQEHEAEAAAAIRELEEETGWQAAEMEYIFTGPTSTGLTSEQVSFFRAGGVVRVHEGGGDHSEDITVHEIPLGEVKDWLLAQGNGGGKAIDPKIFTGLFFVA